LIQGFCNSYYVDDKKKILIDAGADLKKPVDLLILTHLHPDHAFYAQKIKQRTGCKIMALKGKDDLSLLFKHFPSWSGKKMNFFKIDEELKQEEKIITGNYAFEVLSAPGHTKGSICLYEKNHKILFSGDAVFGNGFIGRTDLPGGSEEEMKKTLSKLEKLEIKRLFAGH
ncbi:MAG: MBL fold metallo-hydrolase, partial [Candidatus Nanoarchaeia archaeon]|nr:MBL fold metallo-hydrolase [Candidatus Nanoarchaeia archaeon]